MKKWITSMTILSFCILGAQNAIAQPHLGLTAVGVQLGVVSPEDLDATVGFGGFADLSTLGPNVRLVSNLDVWSKSQDNPFGGTASVGDVALGMRAKYMFPVRSPKLQPFAGAGLGIHFLSAKFEDPGFPTIKDSSTKLGLDLGGGFAAPMSPRTDLLAEMWYGVVDGANQLSVRAGMSFKVGS